jgi:membrane fusion protein (multidrug efflux system)
MRFTWATAIAATSILASVAPLAALGGCKRNSADATVTGDDASAPATHVESAPATEIDVPIQLRLTGSLKGMREADLAANAAGRVTKTFVERGDQVQAGQIVAQIDTSNAALTLAEARVQVDTSRTQEDINQTDCARAEKLFATGAISAAEHDNVTAKCKTAQLGLRAAEARQTTAAKNVGDGAIRAPFAGTVAERFVDVGSYVQAQSKVISIAQTEQLRLEFTVPEANVGEVKQGADVAFTVAAYADKTFHGTVRFVSGSVRAATRDLVVEALVDNGEKKLFPGMFADVALSTGTRKLPSVPLSAVFERQDKRRIFVVKDGRLEERVLQTGPESNGRLSVESGVKTGEPVVTANADRLTNGARVQ